MSRPLPRRLRIQSVLYNTELASLRRAYLCLVNAVDHARRAGLIDAAELCYGDCSPAPLLDEKELADWMGAGGNALPIRYTYFNANLGSAEGHNRLMSQTRDEGSGAAGPNALLLIMNPDVKPAGDTLVHLIHTLDRPQCGFAEARQLPMEHPKAYEEVSGRTMWASTATALTTTDLYWQVEGFDSKTFFLYCDDVDFSWKLREAGYDVVFQPAAVVFHDKRLGPDGSWPASSAERYYSAEAALLLTYKWSRSDLTKRYFESFMKSGDEFMLKACEEFRRREAAGQLPAQRDSQHKVSIFVNNAYAPHRF